MDSPVSSAEINRADKLHSILLFDFIVVHVFLFVLSIGMMKQTNNMSLALIPAISIFLLGYVLIKASQAIANEPSWFVRCHMLLAAKRARLFLVLFMITGSFTALMFFGGPQLGVSKIASYSLAFGIGQLPFMVALLTLVVMEYDASHQCKSGKIPAAAIALHPASTEA
ncbi:MAG: hypothetical protein Q8O24_07770 [Gallionellaceae bacterium]|nr:hypothetical protein [Gallionellaceae bacterium]